MLISNSITGFIQLLTRQFLNIINEFTLFLRAECQCCPCILGSSGTSDTMHIRFLHIRKIIVITKGSSLISIPLAAISVATITRVLPDLKLPKANCRAA